METRKEIDKKILEVYEDLVRVFWGAKEELSFLNQDSSTYNRLSLIEERLVTERRMLEEISLPCRFILEHFSTIMNKPDHTIGFKVGKFQFGRGLLSDFKIEEWGNVVLNFGTVKLSWRDEDYKYFFYPDKVILRSCDRAKPEIHFYFNFTFKYSHLLEMYQDVKDHSQVEYWHEDLITP